LAQAEREVALIKALAEKEKIKLKIEGILEAVTEMKTSFSDDITARDLLSFLVQERRAITNQELNRNDTVHHLSLDESLSDFLHSMGSKDSSVD
jgi:flagellar biosynthesis component FlhA